MSDARSPDPKIAYRCHACEYEFVPGVPGVAPCPRCQAIGGHDRIGLAH